ncbi:GCN5 family acetyltransferase [Serinicoccus chungangensis]|uniref:GCN5 family acetyltransferase n=1 Tax=Serinicoccus chungangensis TaxID=767452 RepID=A0A0W8I225_9MICO|nr:GNAT family N-acetyltransferase [Serinicoccus chungangensis]KUG51787.1 GCN5 family acetyltransferase [Serinicoccus chungangensis]
MSEIHVRVLGPDEWASYKDVRLRALRESPEAFVASAEEEEAFPDSRWQERMERSRRVLAHDGDEVVGVVSVGTGHRTNIPGAGELFGLWVAPARRGTGVARRLLEKAAKVGREIGLRQLVYWVGTDNGRAVAFASSFGFRPTDDRRPMRIRGVDEEDAESEEMMMVYPLGDAAGVPTSL